MTNTIPQDIRERLLDRETPAISLTKEAIDSALKGATIQYHRFPSTTATVCAITLVGSLTTFIGTSDCIDPLNFSQERGEKEALTKATSALADFLAVGLKNALRPHRLLP